MAYERLNFTKLLAAIQGKIQKKTGLNCYDAVPKNAKSPFYFAEIIQTLPAKSKTMYRDNFTVYIHAIAKENDSSVDIYDLIDGLQEALTEDISLPEPFDLVMQTDNGVQTIKTDESKEKHAILSHTFTVCYGFKCKV